MVKISICKKWHGKKRAKKKGKLKKNSEIIESNVVEV